MKVWQEVEKIAIHDHYLTEDFGQVSDNLDVLHTSAMNVLKGATTGDFYLLEQSQIDTERSRKILKALHAKKLKGNEQSESEYLRRNFF